MARRKRALELDDIQMWLSSGIRVLPPVVRAYSLLLATLVYSGKACFVPIERMERYSDELRTKQKQS